MAVIIAQLSERRHKITLLKHLCNLSIIIMCYPVLITVLYTFTFLLSKKCLKGKIPTLLSSFLSTGS